MKQFKNLQVKTSQVFNRIAAILICTLLLSCATGSIIITGIKRPAIDPTEVKIYLDPPAQYENIGIIEVKSEVVFSRQDAQDNAMSELKSKAATVGANGVLLTNTGSQTRTTTGYYSNGIYYGGFSSDHIIAQGKAIFVTQE